MRILALLLVFCISATASADEAAKAIIEKARKATGWDKRTGDNATWKEKGKFSYEGVSMDYDGSFHVTYPDKLRFDMEIAAQGQKGTLTAAVNGDKGWEKLGAQSQDMPKEKVQYVRTELYAMQVFSMKSLLDDKETTLAKIDDADVNGTKCVGVSVTRKEKPVVKMWFGADSGMPMKVSYPTINEFTQWKACTDELYPSDWAEENGSKSFRKMKITRDGKTMIESQMSDYKMPDKVDPKMFEKP